jgi:hypothetical protein
MARTYEAIKTPGSAAFALILLQLALASSAGELRAAEPISQGQVPLCSAVADLIQSGHIPLAKGLAINCNPVSEFCVLRPNECSMPAPVMT